MKEWQDQRQTLLTDEETVENWLRKINENTFIEEKPIENNLHYGTVSQIV